jgi:transcriptional regulator with XRE-family HTH domain
MTLKQYLEVKALSLAQFAEKIGVKRNSISRYVHGRVPDPPTVIAIYRETRGAVAPNDLYDLPKVRR